MQQSGSRTKTPAHSLSFLCSSKEWEMWRNHSHFPTLFMMFTLSNTLTLYIIEKRVSIVRHRSSHVMCIHRKVVTQTLHFSTFTRCFLTTLSMMCTTFGITRVSEKQRDLSIRTRGLVSVERKFYEKR